MSEQTDKDLAYDPQDLECLLVSRETWWTSTGWPLCTSPRPCSTAVEDG